MKLIFYNDSPVFGGHEVMTLLGIRGWLESGAGPVVCFSSQANSAYLEKLELLGQQHDQLQIETVPWHAHKLEALRNRLLPSRARHLTALMKPHHAGLIVAVQGNIELSSLCLHAARQLDIPSCSYIPVPHSHADMGAKLGALRDLICRHAYQLADSYITCTDALAKMLKQHSEAPAQVVYNGVEVERFRPAPRKDALLRFGLPTDKVILGTVGRLEFKQKQQHLLVEAVGADDEMRDRCHLVFCGDGPDADALATLLEQKSVRGTIIPWTDTAPLYPALHALVIPSRYEGLPLVMIEALASGIAVIGSDRDGMKDLLPKSMRFDPAQAGALAETIRLFLANDTPPPEQELVSRIRREMSHEAFQKHFNKALEFASEQDTQTLSPCIIR